MHLHKFNKEQKLAFFALTKLMIHADTQIHINESTYYAMIRLEMGFDNELTIEDKPLSELLKPFNSRMTALWLLQELMGVGYVDENLASEELEMLHDIAKELDFTNDEVEKIRKTVIKTKELIKETNELIKKR